MRFRAVPSLLVVALATFLLPVGCSDVKVPAGTTSDADDGADASGADGESGDGGGCEPRSCDEVGAECGSIEDGCGGTKSCGTCEAPNTCGGGGTEHVCGCRPDCEGKECGGNGCGGNCGSCPSGLACEGGKCTGCGDETCSDAESCDGCPEDCGPCEGSCGDGTCGSGETAEGCPEDCGDAESCLTACDASAPCEACGQTEWCGPDASCFGRSTLCPGVMTCVLGSPDSPGCRALESPEAREDCLVACGSELEGFEGDAFGELASCAMEKGCLEPDRPWIEARLCLVEGCGTEHGLCHVGEEGGGGECVALHDCLRECPAFDPSGECRRACWAETDPEAAQLYRQEVLTCALADCEPDGGYACLEEAMPACAEDVGCAEP